MHREHLQTPDGGGALWHDRSMRRDRESEADYLRRVEGLAHEVVEHALNEPWFAFGDDGQRAERPLERAINELATNLRMVHYEGDGCLDD